MTPDPRAEAEPSVEEALRRARRHAANAAAEALEALRALLDAAALFSSGVPAESHTALAQAAQWLEGLANGLASDHGDSALTRALAAALDAEIARWEVRAQEDPDARAVLRAFLGVRELLWELGIRPEPEATAPARARKQPTRSKPRTRRVERVPIQSG